MDNKTNAINGCNGGCRLNPYTKLCEFKGMTSTNLKSKLIDYSRYERYTFKISIVLFLDDFFQGEKGLCGRKENLLGHYHSIQVAKIECNKDSHCIGIQEINGITKV